ncbi:hypothetical protein HYX04_03280 [Candidatus Woesearchaeota archaeon]|nr:hypothetical protein [Candidatus Woesearchaeota archaeon]
MVENGQDFQMDVQIFVVMEMYALNLLHLAAIVGKEVAGMERGVNQTAMQMKDVRGSLMDYAIMKLVKVTISTKK